MSRRSRPREEKRDRPLTIEESRARRRQPPPRRRRGRWIAVAALVIAAAVAGGMLLVAGRDSGSSDSKPLKAARLPGERPKHRVKAAPKVDVDFKEPPRAGLLFDVRTGQVLWELKPDRELPIASLTKMMSALLIAERHIPPEQVPVTKAALSYEGSGLGVLPKRKKVKLETLLHGLLMVSANDGAIALAQYDSGTVPSFVREMNRKARELGLECTHFNTPHGLKDKGNHSCARDLAKLARADLAVQRIRRITRKKKATLKFPIKGGLLYLNNNNPLLRMGDPGMTGLKTGETEKAGRCYVMTARRRGHHLGVVLLHSPNPIHQVRKLLAAGAQAEG